MNLCIILLTNNLQNDIKPPKYIPKVCYKVGDKSMLEIILEKIVKLKPSKIILMVSKNEIFYINKLIKHAKYSKLISYCIFDRNDNRNISSAKPCYNGKNVLVIPANSPLLSTKGMFRIISENRNIKINNSLFYLKKEYISVIDNIREYSTGDEQLLSERETMIVESQADYDKVREIFEKKNKFFNKMRKKERSYKVP